jgi:hypothetical protein
VFEDVSPALYTCTVDSEWIIDQHGHRVCWVPLDLRGNGFYCQGSTVAIGAKSGRVSWFDFGPISGS